MTDLRMINAVAVVHNAAPEHADEDDEPPSYAADADVVEVAHIITQTLIARGVRAHRVCVGGSAAQLKATLERLKDEGVTTIFNLVEGVEGDASREAEFARHIERAQLAITGSPSSALAIAFRKDQARRVLAAAQVPQAQGYVVWPDQPIRLPQTYPVFIKPACADGSIGINSGSVIYDERAYLERIAWLNKHVPGPALVEDYLPGAELNIASLPTPDGQVLSATAIDFSGYPEGLAPIVSYDCKWTPGSPEYVACSVDARALVDAATIERAKQLAADAMTALGISGYGRVDLRLDAHGQPRVIDVNPNPDLHPEAGVAAAARQLGLTYSDLIMGILDEAQHRHLERLSHDRAQRAAHTLHHRRRPRATRHLVATY